MDEMAQERHRGWFGMMAVRFSARALLLYVRDDAGRRAARSHHTIAPAL